MNIVLIGMRGSGKTVVGNILAQELGREFIEMDRLIIQRAGLSIPEIVERYGWARFRDIEEETAGEVTKLDNIINATGGGVVTREKNVQELKRNGILVWLKASVDSLLERTGQDTNRPPLANSRTQRQDIEITFTERKSLYRKAADIVVNTENKTPEEVAEKIISLLTQRGDLPDG